MTRNDGAALAATSAERVALRKLKPGPGLSRDAVAMDQKMRLRIALSALVAEHGYDAVTVRTLIGRASVSTSTFYNHFDGVEGCLASIVGLTITSVVEDITDGGKFDDSPLAALRAAIRRLTERLAREPQMARAVFVEAFSAGPQVREEMNFAFERFETWLAETLTRAPRPAACTTHLAVGLVAGVVGVIRKTTLAGRATELPRYADELTDWILSVAHEEVVTFRVLRSRPADGRVGGRLPWKGAFPASRESLADAGHRAIMATVRLAAGNGLHSLTSARIRKDAGLSRREFERHFTGVEDCFLEAIESVSVTAARTAGSMAEGAETWERWILRAMEALCSLASGEEHLSRLVLLDTTAAGREGLLRREKLIEDAAAQIRRMAPAGRRPSDLAMSASVSAIWRIAEVEVAASRARHLPWVAPVFVYVILASRRPSDQEQDTGVSELAFATGGTPATRLATAH